VAKTFGVWYQKTNKTEDTNKLKFIGLQNNRHPSQHTVGNVHKPSGNCQQSPDHSQKLLDKPHICNISRLRVNFVFKLPGQYHRLITRWKVGFSYFLSSKQVTKPSGTLQSQYHPHPLYKMAFHLILYGYHLIFLVIIFKC
jgi:hypothetical protein